MANRTAKDAKSIKGTNPQYLVEKIIRTRIYDSKYWKEECFALTAELLVDCAMELDHIGGVYGGNVQPTPFICLVLKMLQIQPSKDIIIEFIKNPDYKYVRALGAIYLRLIGETMECYNYLEPLYNDYRKLKRKNRNGEFELIHIDEFIDELLHNDRVCDIILPRIQKRHILEQNEQLEPRVSALDEDLSDVESEEGDEEPERDDSPHRRHGSPSHRHRDRDRRHRSRSKSPHRRRRSSRSPARTHDNDRDRRRGRSRSRSPRRHHSPSHRSHRHGRKRSHSRSRSPSPHHHHHKHSSEKESKKSDKTKSKEKKSKKESKSKKSMTSSGKELTAEEEEEIRQANELRAKLGLKPLKV